MELTVDVVLRSCEKWKLAAPEDDDEAIIVQSWKEAPILILSEEDCQRALDGKRSLSWILLRPGKQTKEAESLLLPECFPAHIMKRKLSNKPILVLDDDATTIIPDPCRINGASLAVFLTPLPLFYLCPIKTLLLTPLSSSGGNNTSSNSSRDIFPPSESILQHHLLNQPLPHHNGTVNISPNLSYKAQIFSLYPMVEENHEEEKENEVATGKLLLIRFLHKCWGGRITASTEILIQNQSCNWLAPPPSAEPLASTSTSTLWYDSTLFAELSLRLTLALFPSSSSSSSSLSPLPPTQQEEEEEEDTDQQQQQHLLQLLHGGENLQTLLIQGPKGSGKTSLIRTLAAHLRVYLILIQPGHLIAENDVEADIALRKAFQAAQALAPSILLMDNVDLLLPPSKGLLAGSWTELERALQKQLIDYCSCQQQQQQYYGRQDERKRVSLVLTTSREGWELSAERPGLLKKVLMRPLDTCQRLELLKHLLSLEEGEVRRGHSRQGKEEEEEEEEESLLLSIARQCQGFSVGELVLLMKRALRQLKQLQEEEEEEEEEWLRSWERSLEDSLTVMRRERLRSTGVRGVLEERTIDPPLQWEDVGGQHGAKRALQEMLTWPLRCPQAFARLGIRTSTGLLLYGPPGTGKTLLAKTAACQSGAAFLSIRIPDIVRAEIGTAEVLLRQAFLSAQKNRPVVIFIDEFQALFSKRGEGNLTTGGRLASQLLQCMDQLHISSSSSSTHHHDKEAEEEEAEMAQQVMVVAATNAPEALDPAFLRPGRFDRMVYVGLPDQEDREEIVQGLLERIIGHTPRLHQQQSQNYSPLAPLFDDVPALARRSEGYTGADLTNLLRQASLHALSRGIFPPPSSPDNHHDDAEPRGSSSNNNNNTDPETSSIINAQDIDYAFTVCKPTMTPSALQKFEAFRKQYKAYH